MARVAIYTILLFLAVLYEGLNASEDHARNVDENETPSKPIYKSPVPQGFVYLAETFDDKEKFNIKWIVSKAKKDDTDEDIAKYDGVWTVEEPKQSVQDGDLGLVLKSRARHAAISAPLNDPFLFNDKPLIVQYEVNFQEGQECGGAYLKLLTGNPTDGYLNKFNNKSPYGIMFGPDKCGNDQKLHFIFLHKNPLNNSYEEKHCKKPKDRLEEIFKDKQPHLYTLIIRPDNTFEIRVDNKVVNEGSLLDDFTPPVNPPLEIQDPNDKQPGDWDDREKIPDPLAVKPEDWDEDAPAQIVDEEDVMPEGWLEDQPVMIPNPESVKPEDWDIEMDGEWEPPEIPNPKCADAPGCGPYKQKLKKNPRYKGKWLPPLINNPNYKGKWKPRFIHNPNYFNDQHPFRMSSVSAVGFELWSMSPDILFDNIIITDNEDVAKKWAEDSFEIRRVKIAEENESLWGRTMRSMNHKPGWWALYFFYCLIPVIIYIWYLTRRLYEWSLWRQLMTFTAEHPWMWAVYVLVAGLPVLLLIYCCCFSTQEKHDSKPEDKEPLQTNEDINEEETQKQEFQDVDEEETNETSEATNDKEKPLAGGDGPRRRKPNKE